MVMTGKEVGVRGVIYVWSLWTRSMGERSDLCMVMSGQEVGVRGVICVWS